jgi:hypothetical protein
LFLCSVGETDWNGCNAKGRQLVTKTEQVKSNSNAFDFSSGGTRFESLIVIKFPSMSGIPPEDSDLWPKYFDVLILFNVREIIH